MKTILPALLFVISSLFSCADDIETESRFLSLLHKLQYTETPQDLAMLIPDCPEAKPDAGEHNTEIIIKTKLFGFDAVGEFNFHNGILVSHGFRILTPSYEDAHRVFLMSAGVLNSQVETLKLTAALPFALAGEEQSDGPRDEIDIYLTGVAKEASFQLRLEMRQASIGVAWGAQQVRPIQKKSNKSEQATPRKLSD